METLIYHLTHSHTIFTIYPRLVIIFLFSFLPSVVFFDCFENLTLQLLGRPRTAANANEKHVRDDGIILI